VLNNLAEPYLIKDQEIRISASIGIALFPDHAGRGDQLLIGADQAMYRAKESGRNKVVFCA
jgi:diguanylate cyclase (GGDEF)-like protein